MTFTAASYDPAVAIDIFPAAGYIGISVTLTNLNIMTDIDGVSATQSVRVILTSADVPDLPEDDPLAP